MDGTLDVTHRTGGGGGARVCTPHLQNWAVFEVVRAGPSLQRAEGDASAGERRDITVLVSTNRPRLIVSGDDLPRLTIVRLLTGRAVVLIGNPRPIFTGFLVNGKALRPTGLELEANVCNTECFPCKETEKTTDSMILLWSSFATLSDWSEITLGEFSLKYCKNGQKLC